MAETTIPVVGWNEQMMRQLLLGLKAKLVQIHARTEGILEGGKSHLVMCAVDSYAFSSVLFDGPHVDYTKVGVVGVRTSTMCSPPPQVLLPFT